MAKRVLIVDDDDLVRLAICNIIRRSLRETGIEIIEAENGRRALEVLARHENDLWLVISDLDMPVMDGFRFLRELREERARINCVFILHTSSHLAPGLAEEAGADHFLQKAPLDMEGYWKKLKEHVSTFIHS